MKKRILLMIIILMLSGCSYDYELLYKDGKFTDTIRFEGIETGDAIPTYDTILNEGYCTDEACSSKYNITEPRVKDGEISKFTISSKLPKNISKSRIIDSCFENVKFIEKKNFIILKTYGDFYCEADKMKISFVTKSKVLNHNADEVKTNKYIWNKVPKEGINVQVIKEKKIKDIQKAENNKLLIVILILVTFIIVSSVVMFVLIRKKIINLRNL